MEVKYLANQFHKVGIIVDKPVQGGTSIGSWGWGRRGCPSFYAHGGPCIFKDFVFLVIIHCMQVKSILDEFLEKLPEEFNMPELFVRAEEKTPYVLVALQECERMNGLTREMKRSLKEVDLGLKV